MSAVPRNPSWCQVSPLSTICSQYSLAQVEQRFEPSVLSFQRFIYIGKTIPRHSMPPPLLTDKRLIHPFEGFLVFCHWNAINTCQVSQHSVDERDDCFELQNDVITDSKKDGIGNGLIDSCEYVYDNCELDYLPTNTNNTEEDSDHDTDDDNDSVVQFESSCTVVKCPALDPLILCHTFSFSSEESGFCEQSHIEWSDDEDDCDDVTESCNFNEGLWHDFEVQACFTGIPLRNGRNKKTCTKRTLSEQVQTSRSIKLCPLNEQEVMHNTSTITLHSTETSSIGSQHTLSTSDCNYNDIDRLTNTSGKRVTFKPDSELVVVHHLITWKYAYRACRKGPWEQYAADRERFHKRIQTVNAVLAPCLLNKLCTSQITEITEMYD